MKRISKYTIFSLLFEAIIILSSVICGIWMFDVWSLKFEIWSDEVSVTRIVFLQLFINSHDNAMNCWKFKNIFLTEHRTPAKNIMKNRPFILSVWNFMSAFIKMHALHKENDSWLLFTLPYSFHANAELHKSNINFFFSLSFHSVSVLHYTDYNNCCLLSFSYLITVEKNRRSECIWELMLKAKI